MPQGHEVPPVEIGPVIDGGFLCEPVFHGGRAHPARPVGDAEHEGVDAVPVAREEYRITRFCRLQGSNEHDEGRGRARVAYTAEEVVLDLRFVEAEPLARSACSFPSWAEKTTFEKSPAFRRIFS